MGKPPRLCNKWLRPTQPPILSGIGNQYRPNFCDALQRESEDSFHGVDVVQLLLFFSSSSFGVIFDFYSPIRYHDILNMVCKINTGGSYNWTTVPPRFDVSIKHIFTF